MKNASSLCLSWYGAVKLDRKPLRFEQQQRLFSRHIHSNVHKKADYFKETPELPNDFLPDEEEDDEDEMTVDEPDASMLSHCKEADGNESLISGGMLQQANTSSMSMSFGGANASSPSMIGSKIPSYATAANASLLGNSKQSGARMTPEKKTRKKSTISRAQFK